MQSLEPERVVERLRIDASSTVPQRIAFFSEPSTVREYSIVAGISINEAVKDVINWRNHGKLQLVRGMPGKYINTTKGQDVLTPKKQSRIRKKYAVKATPARKLDVPVARFKLVTRSRTKRNDLVYGIIAKYGPLPVKEVARVLHDNSKNGQLTRRIVKNLVQEGHLDVARDSTGLRLFDGGILFEVSTTATQPSAQELEHVS